MPRRKPHHEEAQEWCDILTEWHQWKAGEHQPDKKEQRRQEIREKVQRFMKKWGRAPEDVGLDI
jgi:hypothetical protein